ncbi:MAG: DNA polymerase III subunit gamma/tau [Synergistaceae bacterium]|nr:DNA polymerase III subunit gamma/tau [Synergistaceae bacterium]
MSVSLYRKYRPQNFASVVGQKSAVDILSRSIERNRVGHAYLFSGSRGCGKTSVARIFAKALNCLSPEGFEPCGKCRNCLDITAGDSLDVIEIDGASNNGVENIRGLKENVTLAPFNSRYKIYIIDEVHMLSQGAFNALLKTLEEPPEHVIFIMATTEPHKVPVTIRSRCQHIPFRSITPDDIFSRLEYVCQSENINAEPEALREISRQSEGALRDALSLLEQATAAGDVTLERVEAIFGAGSRPAFERWIKSLRENPETAYKGLKEMFDAGASSVRVFEEMFTLVRDLWLVSKWKSIADSLNLSEQDKNFLLAEAQNWKPSKLNALLNIILKILTQARSGIRNDILLGMFILAVEGDSQPVQNETIRSDTPVARSVPVPQTERSSPQPEPVISAPVQVEEDKALKEELLNISRGKNIMIYCAMFDARPFRRGEGIVIDMQHVYCFEVMRLDRNSAELAEIFADYGNVILRYGTNEYQCQKIFEAAPESLSTKTNEQKPSARQKINPFIAEFIASDSDMPVQESSGQSSTDRPDSETSKTKQAPSIFSELLQNLRGMGLKPEVVLLKHSEADESSLKAEEQDDNDDDEHDDD